MLPSLLCQWVPGREVNHSLELSVEVKDEWGSVCAPSLCLDGVDRENFTFSFHCTSIS